nr:transporter domain protein [Rhodococcus sp. JVH1]
MFVVAWGGNQFTPLLTMYRAERGYSELAVNTLLFAYVIGLIPSLLLAHRLAERWGPRLPWSSPCPRAHWVRSWSRLGRTTPF